MKLKSISHSSSLFVTNIDNTSDRERVTSVINIEIFDKEKIVLLILLKVMYHNFTYLLLVISL